MFSKRFQEVASAFESLVFSSEALVNEEEAMRLCSEMLSQVKFRKGVVYVIGNGGSAALASHFSAELTKNLRVPSIALLDSAVITCLGNDWGFDQVFSDPLSQLLKAPDLLVAISGSGKSPNILKGAHVAKEKEVSLITLTGFSKENPLRKMGDLNFWIDRSDYGLIETIHFFLLHAILDCAVVNLSGACGRL